MTRIIHQTMALVILFSTVVAPITALNEYSLSLPLAQPAQTMTVSFTWYKFLLVGNSINFTAKVFGGTAPYTYAWDFGDTQTLTGPDRSVLHTYSQPGNLTVILTVTDFLGASDVAFQAVSVLAWPTSWAGWLIRHNITSNDGVALWNVTYRGRLVINDARLAGIMVRYKDNFCQFYDEFDAQYTDVGFFEYFTSGPDPYLQIRTTSIDRFFSLVGGYWYEQVWRFYISGRWDAEVWLENGGGCGADHYYEPHWRFDLALGNSSEFTSNYGPSGKWNPLVWEGNYTDNGFRDMAHNGSQWRFNGAGASYYLVPKATPVTPNQEFPRLTSRIYLVKSKPNEVELTPNILFNFENPAIWINNGELAFNRDLAFWFLGFIWVHAPLAHTNGSPANTVTLSFYPDGL